MAFYHEENAAERQLRLELRRRKIDCVPGAIISGREIDFFLPRHQLALEIDGLTHASETARLRDESKERLLQDLGITLLRLANREVLANPRAAGELVEAYVRSRDARVRRAGKTSSPNSLELQLRRWAARAGMELAPVKRGERDRNS